MSGFVVGYRKIWWFSRTAVEGAVSSIGCVAETLLWDSSAKRLARAARARWLGAKFQRRWIVEIMCYAAGSLKRQERTRVYLID